MNRPRGRVALVTGAGGALGRATAARLAADGFDVGFTWHSEEERAQDAAREIEQHGRRAEARQADLHDAAVAERVIGELADALGGIDVLVNNAGVA